jgi:DNA (cytosine-5)-methyltransferase 1
MHSASPPTAAETHRVGLRWRGLLGARVLAQWTANMESEMAGWLRNKTATVVDLFAGTGGMGIASILTPNLKDRARIVYVGELDADYVSTIRRNYQYFAARIGSKEQVPHSIEPADVSSRKSLERLDTISRRHGGVTLLLAGPPCQGFSKSNRISREHSNPKNLLALDTVDAIKAAVPQVAIIENVPGIQTIASARRRSLTVTEHIERELENIGYHVQTVLLDAADYGVPQHRLRSFTIAISTDIAHEFDHERLIPKPMFGFGRRFPYRTVADALSDLPKLKNGASGVVSDYARAASSTFQREARRFSRALYDHVTTRHSAYVLDRYAAIPAGGNWTAIRHKLRNYAHPDNTHTNIYHRLDPRKPSKTIGNFRKAMTIHPWEDRGLSLREAARLQSLPDWLRFFPDEAEMYRGQLRGLGVRQQQVGNAVCFRLTAELVSHLFKDA